ncbi:uncharacterized protein LOC143289974 [Babylonia areolata]|uniref:uncharacterized protein LOC143289974 n=1 Tax=Babylonia areolata TaxID=304850 RepID=UPI003FD32812
MEWTALSHVVLAIFLSIEAESAVSFPPEDRSLSPDPSALYDERVMKLLSDLKELFQEGDSHLKERIEEGLGHVKEQRKEGDERLKEELDEDVEWLKERQDKRQRQTEDEVAEGEAVMNKEITELKEAFGKLRDSVMHCTQLNSAMTKDLKQQMSDFQAELNSTQDQLQTTQDQLHTTQDLKQQMSDFQAELNSTQDQLQTTQEQLHTTQDLKQQMSDFQAELNSTQDQLHTTQDQLHTTQDQLHTTQDQLHTTQDQLHTTQDQIHSLRASNVATEERLNSTQADLVTAQEQLQTAQDQVDSLKAIDVGSTYIRWGHSACPATSDLVYSGVAGGVWHTDSGGASNYLCLVMTPEVDNTTRSSAHTYVYGVEYQGVPGRDNQDAVCSVCRAPQSTTHMIPATRTCPSGWTAQYRGYLMAASWSEKRTEFVCVDEEREYRHGGQADRDGALLYPVVAGCSSSLLCPPYVHDKVVTCVVCSL